VAVLHDGSAWDLAKRGVPVSWVAPAEGVPILDQVAHVTRGSKQKELAWKLVNEYLTSEVQLAYATELFFSPTNRNVKLPAEVATKIISGPKDVDSLVIFDWSQIVTQRPAWTARWHREIRESNHGRGRRCGAGGGDQALRRHRRAGRRHSGGG